MLRRLFDVLCFVFAGPETHSAFREFQQRQALVAAENRAAAASDPSGLVEIAVSPRPFPERYDNYGRPQQIPAEVRARLRREWETVGQPSPVDDAIRSMW